METAESPAAAPYALPVARLLTLGEVNGGESHEWLDYAGEFGLGPEHADELIRLAVDPVLNSDPPDGVSIWATNHAWRALGKFRVEAAVGPLLTVLRDFPDDDSALEDVPVAIGTIGPAALPLLAARLAELDSSAPGSSSVAEAVLQVAQFHPEQREACVSLLTRSLERYADQNDWFNAALISRLVDLKAVESIDTIQAAFHAEKVELFYRGDLEDVEIDLGLREQRATPKPDYLPAYLREARDMVLARIGRRAASDREPLDWRAPVRTGPKVGRNESCPCGSGKKYKKCCLEAAAA